nr:hypothetical protein [Tanacetum cinerariifolium]
MFLTHSDEALEIEKFKRSRENKIEFAYDYRNLNASYVNEKINFLDDYFQKIINPDFEKIDPLFQPTSSLKPYILNVILEKIIIDLEDEVVSLLEKEKANLKTIESLKSKSFESSENAISELENQSENNCHVIEKECDKVENPKRYSRKDLLSCNNSHLEETSSAYVCNDAMNVSCNSRMCDLFDDNNFFIFDDEIVRISPVSKMPFKKKPHDSINICLWIIDSGCSKHMTGNRGLLTNFVGMVRFGNNDFAVIAGYGDVVIDAYFDASTLFHDPSNVHTFYQPYPHEKKWTKDHPLHKIIGDPKSSVRTRGQLANSCLFSCLLSFIEPANVAKALEDADWVSAMQEELDQFARMKVWRLVPRPEGKSVIKTKWIFKNKKYESSLVILCSRQSSVWFETSPS